MSSKNFIISNTFNRRIYSIFVLTHMLVVIRKFYAYYFSKSWHNQGPHPVSHSGWINRPRRHDKLLHIWWNDTMLHLSISKNAPLLMFAESFSNFLFLYTLTHLYKVTIWYVHTSMLTFLGNIELSSQKLKQYSKFQRWSIISNWCF